MSSTPKWALVIDENNKTSAIVKTKNLPSSNSAIRVVSLSNKKSSLQSNKTLLTSKELEVLEDSTEEDTSSDDDDDYSSSSGNSSSSEDEVMMRCSAPNKLKKKCHTFIDNGSSSITLNSQIQQQQTSHLLNEVMRLKKKVKRLKKEKAKVVKMNWKLQESVPKMIDLFSKYQQHLPTSVNTISSNSNKHSTSTAGTSQCRTLRSSSNASSHQLNSNQDPLIIHHQKQSLINPDVIQMQPIIDNNAVIENSEQRTEGNENFAVSLNSADDLLEFLTEEQLANACRKNTHYKKVISNIMECLFTEEEMTTSSVTGINTSKQPLDLRKSSALINFIQAHFPHVSVSQVKQRMGFKLRDKRKLCHQR